MTMKERIEKAVEDVERFGDFYEMYRTEKTKARIATLLRNIFFVWALVMTMLVGFLLWYMAGFTYVEPESVTYTQTAETTADNGSNAVVTFGENSGVVIDGGNG